MTARFTSRVQLLVVRQPQRLLLLKQSQHQVLIISGHNLQQVAGGLKEVLLLLYKHRFPFQPHLPVSAQVEVEQLPLQVALLLQIQV